MEVGEGLCPEMAEYHLWLALHESLHYDGLSGKWTWLINKKGPGAKRGAAAGRVSTHGQYRRSITIKFNQVNYLSHRLAWFYMTGEWPTEIDHINRNPMDNRWHNLREVSHAENFANSTLRNSPVSGRFERREP